MRWIGRYVWMRCLFVLGAFGVLGVSPSGMPQTARASVLVKLSLSEMTARAEHVLVGRVEKVTSQFVTGQDGMIWTEVYIRCARSIRGVREGEVLKVRHLGGTVGELGQKVFGEASYRMGEEVLILAEEREGTYFSIGMAQGKFHVDRSNGTPLVQVDLAGAEILSPTGTPATGQVPTAQGVPLEVVIAQLQDLVKRIPSPSERRKQNLRQNLQPGTQPSSKKEEKLP